MPPYDATLVTRLRAGRPADPRQDQHGRVRDGLLDRALRLRPDPQPVGPRPDPRRLRRRLGRGGRRVRGAAGDRHRHRRLDPPAGRGHRHGRRQADVRWREPLRAGRDGELARPGRPGHPYGAGRGAAARGHRRPRPAGLHLASTSRCPTWSPPAAPARDRRPDRRADRRGQASSAARATRPASRQRFDESVDLLRRRPAPRSSRCPARTSSVRAGGLLPDPAGRGLQQPRQVRRDALRPAGAARGHRGPERRGGHARHPRRRLRRRGQAPHHPRHLRPVQRLLRRLLRPGAEGAHADQPRLRRGVRAGRRAGLADRADHGVQARREARRPAGDVPQRPRHHPGQPRRHPRASRCPAASPTRTACRPASRSWRRRRCADDRLYRVGARSRPLLDRPKWGGPLLDQARGLEGASA